MAGNRGKVIAWTVALIVVFFASAGVAVSHVYYYDPKTVFDSICLLIKLGFEHLFDPGALQTKNVEMNAIDGFYEVRTRLLISVLTAACGALLAISGSLYQQVFRNPIAAPTMLGVSNGVSIGVLILILQFGGAAAFMTGTRYLYCFVGAVVILGLVVGVTLAACRGKGFSVIVMLLAGSIVSQVAGSIVGYITMLYLNDSELIAYQNILQVLDVSVEPITFAVLGAVILVSAIPVFIMRFSLNALALEPEEMRVFGMSPAVLRVVAIGFGTIMIIGCEVLVGTVSMVALFVPFISRATFGAEFRKQLLGNALIGSTILLGCRAIADLIPFAGEGFPIGVIVSFVALPFFVAAIVLQQRTWE